ncbi:MAG TPA: rod-binding protein [Clostridia bacterium]|nr:rod-binding protein [Clostridia bacterium]
MNVSPFSPHLKAADLPPERLANNAALSQQEKIAEASRQFEAILLRQILASAQKPALSSSYADNSTAGSIYRDMITNELADSISKSGVLGLAQTFERQLAPESAGTPAQPTTFAD